MHSSIGWAFFFQIGETAVPQIFFHSLYVDCNSLTLLVILHLRKRERKTWRLSNRKANEEGKKHVSIVATSKRIKKKACEYCSKRRRKKACQFCKDTTKMFIAQ